LHLAGSAGDHGLENVHDHGVVLLMLTAGAVLGMSLVGQRYPFDSDLLAERHRDGRRFR
jgi:hypothetical protein